jgi:hypothetical protein
MSTDERGRSPELDQLRQTLFPNLSPEDGAAEIEKALRAGTDDEQWRRIEARLKERDVYGDLLAVLYDLRASRRSEIT